MLIYHRIPVVAWDRAGGGIGKRWNTKGHKRSFGGDGGIHVSVVVMGFMSKLIKIHT